MLKNNAIPVWICFINKRPELDQFKTSFGLRQCLFNNTRPVLDHFYLNKTRLVQDSFFPNFWCEDGWGGGSC